MSIENRASLKVVGARKQTPPSRAPARAIARRAAGDRSKYLLRDSLYYGAVGVSVLVEDLEQPALAAMPLFEPAR
jgi:hypothetical protein